jgi:hypothetical protein
MKILRAPVLLVGVCFAIGLAGAEPDEVAHSRIKRQPVVSSNVASIGYSRHLHALEVEFTRGAIYRFLDVPAKVHRDLLAAESKGRFITENIRGKYNFVRVRGPRARAEPPVLAAP